MDPTDPLVLYYGANRVYKTTDGANNWTAISPDLSNGQPANSNLTFGTVISLSISPLDSDVIYAGTDDGNVWVTSNGGTDWDLITNGLPQRWVTKVLADRSDVNAVYVTFSGYRYGEDNGHVYRSTDMGANWTDIGLSLPDIPINDIVKDSNEILFLGTDIGVLASEDEGANWQVLDDNLPSVVVTDMHIDEPNDLLYAATYGRSSYRLDLSGDILGVSTQEFAAQISVYPNPASDWVEVSGLDTSENVAIKIYDTMGKQLSEVQLGGSNRFNVEALSSGIYYVTVSEGQKSATKKLIAN